MAKIYFICGFVGSGKTTYSNKLSESAPAFRFSIDEWMIPLWGEHMERDLFEARMTTLQNLFKEASLQMLKLGVSVIFDFGFWTEAHRTDIANWAIGNDLEYEFHYLDVSFEECSKRALSRSPDNMNKVYEMTPQMLTLFWSWFEIPDYESVIVVPNSALTTF